MIVKLRYFAAVREKAGIEEEEVDLPDGLHTIADLMSWLQTKHPGLAEAFAERNKIAAAIDHEHVRHDTPIMNAKEVAFFPPVTGG